MAIIIYFSSATLLAFILITLLIPVIIRLSRHFEWYDHIDHRKIHSGEISQLGGVGIFLVVVIVSTLFIIFEQFFPRIVIEKLDFPPGFLFIFGGAVLIHLLGLIDDFSNLNATPKFIVQIFAALLVTSGGFSVGIFSIPFIWQDISLGYFTIPITALWIVGITNAINLIDGMDGLAGGIAGIAAFFYGMIFLLEGYFLAALISLILFGAILGFLVFNFPPATIFMGDSGALLIGFLLAVLPLLEIPQPVSTFSLIPAVTILFIPIMDTFFAIIRRKVKREAIGKPDNEHIHHKFLRLGLNHKQILSLIYGITLLFGIITIAEFYLNKTIGAALAISTWIVSLIFYIFLDNKKQQNNPVKE